MNELREAIINALEELLNDRAVDVGNFQERIVFDNGERWLVMVISSNDYNSARAWATADLAREDGDRFKVLVREGVELPDGFPLPKSLDLERYGTNQDFVAGLRKVLEDRPDVGKHVIEAIFSGPHT